MPALLLVGDYVVSNVESCILRVGRLFSEIVVVTAEALEKNLKKLSNQNCYLC